VKIALVKMALHPPHHLLALQLYHLFHLHLNHLLHMKATLTTKMDLIIMPKKILSPILKMTMTSLALRLTQTILPLPQISFYNKTLI
jgi:hypothetical protein